MGRTPIRGTGGTTRRPALNVGTAVSIAGCGTTAVSVMSPVYKSLLSAKCLCPAIRKKSEGIDAHSSKLSWLPSPGMHASSLSAKWAKSLCASLEAVLERRATRLPCALHA